MMTAHGRRVRLIAKAKKKRSKRRLGGIAPLIEKPKITFDLLSDQKRPKQFVKCLRDKLIFENDLNTMHAPCPKCGAVMENISKEAAENAVKEWYPEVKSQ